MLLSNEKLEPLGNNIYVIVSDIHKFNTDTILLANFANPKKNDIAIDLGTGCGTIPLIWNRDKKTLNTVAIDIQLNACNMFKRSIEFNSLNEKITVINSDLKDLKGKVDFSSFDLLVCNPPYKMVGTGILNDNDSKKTARHEHLCTIDDITYMASKLLKPNGRFCLCQRPERLCDIITSMRKYNIEPKKLRFAQQRTDKASKLFLIEGKKCASPGLTMLPTLIIESANGEFSDEMKSIYGIYGENKYEW